MPKHAASAVLCALVIDACTSSAPATQNQEVRSDTRVRAFADAFLAAHFDRFPEFATYNGVPGRRHDVLTDNSLDAPKAWAAREDAWLAELKSIDPGTIEAEPLRATYAIVRQTLEGDAAKRVCRDELWPVSQMTGWQIGDGDLVTIQPVGNPEARKEALARWGALPKYIDTEIANLREGVRLGYTAPKLNVRIVIDQVWRSRGPARRAWHRESRRASAIPAALRCGERAAWSYALGCLS